MERFSRLSILILILAFTGILLAVQPGDPSYLDIATQAYMDKDWDKSAEYYQKWVNAQPSDHRAWYNLACVLALKGQPEQAAKALSIKPDYIGVGPVYRTPAKEKPDPVLGLVRMGNILKKTPLTSVAIGGITLENIKDVLQAGAVNFSAVRAVMQSEKPYNIIREFQKIWQDVVKD